DGPGAFRGDSRRVADSDRTPRIQQSDGHDHTVFDHATQATLKAQRVRYRRLTAISRADCTKRRSVRQDGAVIPLPDTDVVTGAHPVDEHTKILGIETSCDETAASVVVGGNVVRSSVVSSQVDLHARFGGVVPEIASRAHVDLLTPVIAEALVEGGVEGPDLDAVAATYGPDLVGSLLVGVSTAKALALVWDVPFVAVNHLEAHLYAALLEDPTLELPMVVLLVSGGHTLLVSMEHHGHYRLLGSTLDDAAGEA